ncbi:MAG: DNA polymerase III subunit delta [Erysipelotrichia bacterium]|nr:DNA polymerase III subunit delta [Erysipelotrichia bacterium]NCC54595.1 DNA polymerase III subunit delta [Erysipelotrichia bacterium]
MIHDEIKRNQPIAYRILENALLKKQLAHAYLFTGEEGTPKLETAYLLVQSLLCEQDGFACETCAMCQHVVNGGYADLIYIDGKTKSIKKNEIMEVQERFSKTKLETKGKKVYILDGVENATKEALNSLLKFLEEPESDSMAILISEHSDRLLETIVSRCQVIPFYKNNTEELEQTLKEEMGGCEAHILSRICVNKEQALERFESDEFQHAFYLFENFLKEQLNAFAYAKIFLQNEGFNKSKRNDRYVLTTFLDILSLLCRDCYLYKKEEIIRIWGKSGEIMLKLDLDKIHMICVESKDKIVRSVNIPLLVDQFLYKWEVSDGK